MSTVLNTNLPAHNTARHLRMTYARLGTSVERLSSGMRVNRAADDAAGLAIRELMRVDIAAMHQGMRNANDAISLLQTADGALAVIDEKLIRMKELAMQAATGTYNSDQRLMIDSEFQAMASEIERIARSTQFNGIRLLDGSLSGEHNGAELAATGRLKVHFGPNNDAAEDYYYLNIDDATLTGLGLRYGVGLTATGVKEGVIFPLGKLPGANDKGYQQQSLSSGTVSMAYIPKGSKNVSIIVDGLPGWEDDIQLFTRDGYHLCGTQVSDDPALNDISWEKNQINSPADAAKFMTRENGFLSSNYKFPGQANDTGKPAMQGTFNSGLDPAVTKDTWTLDGGITQAFQRDGQAAAMNITYSGDYSWLIGNKQSIDWADLGGDRDRTKEKVSIDTVTEDLLLIVSGTGIFDIQVQWDNMPKAGLLPEGVEEQMGDGDVISISTQELAQKSLPRLDEAIIKKDAIRAHLGAMQNRLENTISNLSIQAENLQTAESRISDTDVATETTTLVRNQLLTQSATAMLAQANGLPKMLLELLNN